MGNLTLDDFEKFTDKRRVATHKPAITIGKAGRVSVNKFAYEKYFKLFKYVEFYYKPNEKIVALKLLKKPTDNAYEIRKAAHSNIGGINAIAFFKHHNIDVSAKHYTEFLGVDEKKGIIFFKIKE